MFLFPTSYNDKCHRINIAKFCLVCPFIKMENYSCLKYFVLQQTKQLLNSYILYSMDAYEKGKDTEKKAKNLALRRERLAAMLRQERYRFEVSHLTDIICS